MIAAKIKVDDTVGTIAEIVSDIFSRQFEPQGFLVEDCQDVATKIRLNIDNLSLKTSHYFFLDSTANRIYATVLLGTAWLEGIAYLTFSSFLCHTKESSPITTGRGQFC